MGSKTSLFASVCISAFLSWPVIVLSFRCWDIHSFPVWERNSSGVCLFLCRWRIFTGSPHSIPPLAVIACHSYLFSVSLMPVILLYPSLIIVNYNFSVNCILIWTVLSSRSKNNTRFRFVFVIVKLDDTVVYSIYVLLKHFLHKR